MSVVIPKGAKFLGTSLVTVRNLLKLWDRNGAGTAQAFADHGTIRLSPITTAVLIDELELRGLIGLGKNDWGSDVQRGVTEAGKGLMVAQATRRTPKAKAVKVLDGIFDAAEAINARSDLPFRMKELWLFGSMIDPAKDDVGDIDLVPVFEGTMARDQLDAERSRYWQLGVELGGPLHEFRWRMNERPWVQNRLLYGPRRNPLIAPNDIDQVASLGCRCQLVFDVSRGGRVEDEPLLRHPTSKGRDPSSLALRVMPDLDPPPGSIVPVDVSLLLSDRHLQPEQFEALCSGFSVMGDTIVDTWRYHGGRIPTIVLENDPDDHVGRDPISNPFVGQLDVSGCDGRTRFGMLLEGPRFGNGWQERPAGCAMVVARSIEEADEGVVYRLRIEQFLDDGSPKSRPMMLMGHWALDVVLQADLERIMARRVEAGRPCRIEIEVSSASEAKPASLLVACIAGTSELVAMETAMRANCVVAFSAARYEPGPAASAACVP